MQVIQCFSVAESDGCGGYNSTFYIANECEADAWKKKHPDSWVQPKTITIFDTLEEVEENSIEKIKERALAKLTALERKTLGL